ncbi:MAG: hypothetical protein HZB55_11565 [Deltaproteobacteria bacterium]|nr:hypothetical protein [Deltaproteobacteria bacterium]
MSRYVAAIDQGTTGTRCLLFDRSLGWAEGERATALKSNRRSEKGTIQSPEVERGRPGHRRGSGPGSGVRTAGRDVRTRLSVAAGIFRANPLAFGRRRPWATGARSSGHPWKPPGDRAS